MQVNYFINVKGKGRFGLTTKIISYSGVDDIFTMVGLGTT